MRTLRMLVVFLSSLALLGCMTLQPLTTNPAQLAQALKPGDRVELTTKTGQRLDFKVERIDEQGLQGSGHTIAYADIENINRKKFDGTTTTLVIVGVAAAVGLAAAAGGGGGGSGSY